MEYQKKAGQKMWMVVDFVKNGTLMSLYRDISEVRNKAGLYNEFYGAGENKKNTFAEIVDLLEEQDFPENWFETKFDRMDEVIENIVELLEVDAEQFELYVRSFENQVWFKAKKVEVKVESESDSDGEEDSGAGAVEDSDDESDDYGVCRKCGKLYYQYDILETKEQWEKWCDKEGGTPCECVREESESEDDEEENCEYECAFCANKTNNTSDWGIDFENEDGDRFCGECFRKNYDICEKCDEYTCISYGDFISKTEGDIPEGFEIAGRYLKDEDGDLYCCCEKCVV